MNKILKAANSIFIILNTVIAFILGMALGGLILDGENKGFEGGAIIFNYGLIAALIVLIISVGLIYKLKKEIIVKINIAGLIILGFSIAFLANKANDRSKPSEQPVEIDQQKIIKKSTSVIKEKKKELNSLKKNNNEVENRSIGLGIFKPNILNLKTLYFYGFKSNSKELDLIHPVDSVTFKKGKYNAVDIASAPPWLVPAHLKLDYDIFMFKTKEVSQEYYKIEVNKTTHQTSFVLRNSGDFEHWADFLLGVNAVEFLDDLNQKLKIKPLDNGGVFNMKYSFLSPISIKEQWMKVKVLDKDYNLLGEAWLKWREGGNMLVRYSILS